MKATAPRNETKVALLPMEYFESKVREWRDHIVEKFNDYSAGGGHSCPTIAKLGSPSRTQRCSNESDVIL